MFKNALVSVSDKSGLTEFLRPLTARGLRIVSTGGTASYLRQEGFDVIDVSDQTAFPEVMGGRVKTLHPKIHMALLARLNSEEDDKLLREHDLTPFDLVICNLYPFKKTLESQKNSQIINTNELIENIDIGGPTILRASAKNHERITVISEPQDYGWILQMISQKDEVNLEDRRRLAAKVFSHISEYDALIAKTLDYLANQKLNHQNQNELIQTIQKRSDSIHSIEKYPGRMQSIQEQTEDNSRINRTSNVDSMEVSSGEPNISEKNLEISQSHFFKQLRYGENPQQKSIWNVRSLKSPGLHQAEILQGKELSFNNILDLDAATRLVKSLVQPAAVGVKHNNPCGVGMDASFDRAIEKCLQADPLSLFGGILACNQRVEKTIAEILSKIFLECIIAPDFSEEAIAIFSRKKNLRLLRWSDLYRGGRSENKNTIAEFCIGSLEDARTAPFYKESNIFNDVSAFEGLSDMRTIQGGFLLQSEDSWSGPDDWKFLGQSATPEILNDLIFGERVCASLKSNAIAIVANGQTLGLGMGQVNRVDAVAQAIERMFKFGHDKSFAKVLISDAFFPFSDSIDLAAKAGIQWILQPGGSVKDEEVFARAQALGLNMVITGKRHFRH